MIPRLSLQAHAGNGVEPGHVEVQNTLAFRREWLEKKNLKAQFLQVYEAKGYSMAPYIEDGDIILIDTEALTPKNNEVWVIYQPEPAGVRIKRIMFRDSGDVVIRSDNPDKTLYPDEIVSKDAIEGLEIVGKLAWRGG